MFKALALITFFTNLLTLQIWSQSSLRVSYSRFGATKIENVYVHDILEYRLKGESRFRKDKIATMQDSVILFETYEEIRLNQIRALRLRPHRQLTGIFQSLFFAAGIGFVGLNTINNLITNTEPVINEKAVYISGGLLAVGLIIREMGIKRIRMTKNKSLKILNIDFQHMNNDSTSASK